MTQKKDYKIKVLVLADSPTVSTGFGVLSRNLLKELYNTGNYDFTVIGINFRGGWYDQNKFPYKIYPAMPNGYTDPYGRGLLHQVLSNRHPDIKGPFDLVFIIQDHFILAGADLPQPFNVAKEIKKIQFEMLKRPEYKKHLFNFIFYTPVDGNLRPYWVQDTIAMADYPVSYTEYGKREMLKYDLDKIVENKLTVIPHGVSVENFYPISDVERKEFRDKYFAGAVKEDTFLIVNISRNQIRKDLARTLEAYAKYKKMNDKAHLYLHCKDFDQGGDIWEIAFQLGLKEGDFSLPGNFEVDKGVSVEELNKIYNSADCLLTTTLGEGWGFINTESMAVKKPIIAPVNSSIPEIFNVENGDLIDIEGLEKNYKKFRGIPVKLGTFVNFGAVDNAVLRPTTDVNDVVMKLDWVFNNPTKVKKIAENGYEWVQTLKWKSVAEKWNDLFLKAFDKVEEMRNEADRPRGKNEPCFCGSGLKFKHCHGKTNTKSK